MAKNNDKTLTNPAKIIRARQVFFRGDRSKCQ
ncbi:hypothetical protein APX70_200121 [Pseudomonas syringae pv. maculicola]|uniref:Uncharacterized protein n=1 Tax=Pseudomonas syringae pv. maculicola TaxID=59511 RepID=A0A3M2Y7X4_PSEYM|nr:hypothetical protein APX70_200121 [Pseudomonas syringae pv. maculicola]